MKKSLELEIGNLIDDSLREFKEPHVLEEIKQGLMLGFYSDEPPCRISSGELLRAILDYLKLKPAVTHKERKVVLEKCK